MEVANDITLKQLKEYYSDFEVSIFLSPKVLESFASNGIGYWLSEDKLIEAALEILLWEERES